MAISLFPKIHRRNMNISKIQILLDTTNFQNETKVSNVSSCVHKNYQLTIARQLVLIQSGWGGTDVHLNAIKLVFAQLKSGLNVKLWFLKHDPRFAAKNTARLVFAELLGPCSLGDLFSVLCWWPCLLCPVGGHFFALLVGIILLYWLLVTIFSEPCWWALFCSATTAVLVVSAFWQLVRVLGRIGQGGFCAKMTIGE